MNDAYLVLGIVDTQPCFITFPIAWQAWRNLEPVAAPADAQDDLDDQAVGPCGGAGVPGPAAASGVGRLRINVRGNDVGLDPVCCHGLR